MIWQQMSQYRIESPEGYIISKSKYAEEHIYVARAPKAVGYLYSGKDGKAAKAACDKHLQGVAA
ncbi:hypothetical protein [Pseudomonas paeninsulae]|uniref:hypothetical protein n=1 Tax=Pseudomonas paeninsulae TaxID=3110772 RepID=UPI002D76D039|nr:hypothetical protein [Pseudomonas sp. IT1137]